MNPQSHKNGKGVIANSKKISPTKYGISTIESKTRSLLNALNEESIFSPSLDENITTIQKKSKLLQKSVNKSSVKVMGNDYNSDFKNLNLDFLGANPNQNHSQVVDDLKAFGNVDVLLTGRNMDAMK